MASKKELDVLVKVLSAHHNGVVVVLSSDQLHVHTATNFHKKVRRLALKSVYSEKVAENKFVAVDALSFTAPKTAEFAKVLAALSIDSKVLVILEEGNEFAALSARNLPNVKVALLQLQVFLTSQIATNFLSHKQLSLKSRRFLHNEFV